MNSPRFFADIHDHSILLTLREKRGLLRKEVCVPFRDWQNTLPEKSLPLLVIINDLLDNKNGIAREDYIEIPHESITGLTETQASLLGLPPPVPFAFDIKTEGTIDREDFRLSTSWVSSGGVRKFGLKIKGAFVVEGSNYYRIPSPVFEIVKAAEVLSNNQIKEDSVRYPALTILQELISKDNDLRNVWTDRYLGSIRVLHASAFSLQIPTTSEGFQFDPILFSSKAVGRAKDNGRILDEAENLLTDHLQSIFTSDRFKRWVNCRDCYAINDGVYVYIDPDLKKALGVVRKLQQASAEERKKFIQFPQKILQEYLSEDCLQETIEHIFVETEQYADNVVGLGLWDPPVIPWLVKQPNSWLPEKFGIKIGDTYVQIKPEDIDRIRREIAEKLSSSENGKQPQQYILYDDVSIPATPSVLEGLQKLNGIVSPNPDISQKEHEKIIKGSSLYFLLINDNIQYVKYYLEPIKRASESVKNELPVVLKSTLKNHQKEGMKWLVDSWVEGVPGVLLADDMGLGKTLQALTFLAFLKERKQKGDLKCKEPVLIVAPTGLLNNWKKEIQSHLREPYLGEVCEAYGRHLSAIKIANQNDLNTGQMSLNRDQIRRFDVVLTTYETYRDYHHSFGGIRFSTVVLDECQKIKNPKSQVNRAIASMNAEFIIAMTGTPVENALEDLWAILDRVWPGFLGDLKSFSTKYSPDNHQALRELTNRLNTAATSSISTPIFQRRMKENILHDLPQKIIHLEQKEMPNEQAEAYMEVVNRAKEMNPPPMLFTLHKLRGISLHPIDPDSVLAEASFDNHDSYIEGSARIKRSIQVLDSIHAKNEKALIFIESIAMQQLMAEIIKRRYRLPKRPDIINGKTGDRIQRFVDDFQEDYDFDVMILSPKVGGVGLTLTAANHVIHLSRWWNPAVEDQSTDRAYRIGQKKDVHVYYPMAIHPDMHIREHSFDLKLDELLTRKRGLSRDMLIPPEDSFDTEHLFSETVGFTPKTSSITIDELNRMDGKTFEHWILQQARQYGFQADATKESWDHGADGILIHKETGKKFILQCKHSSSEKISDYKVIQDLLRARDGYDAKGDADLVAITNSHFSDNLLRSMEQTGIRYFDRRSIIYWPTRL